MIEVSCAEGLFVEAGSGPKHRWMSTWLDCTVLLRWLVGCGYKFGWSRLSVLVKRARLSSYLLHGVSDGVFLLLRSAVAGAGWYHPSPLYNTGTDQAPPLSANGQQCRFPLPGHDSA